MCYRSFVAVGAALGVSVGASLAGAQTIDTELNRFITNGTVAAVASDAAMPYFDQRVSLGVYPAMIAVYIDPESPEAHRPAIRNLLNASGLAGAIENASAVPGWTYVVLPQNARSIDDAQRSVRQLADQRGVGMTSLVYLGQGGLPVIPTHDLLIFFTPDTTDAQQSAVLHAHGATLIERDAAGTPGLVRARTGVRTGEAMLRTAVEVNDDPAVAWAQSDNIFWARRAGTPNDPLFGQQWALEQPNNEDMDALDAWSVTMGDPSIRVVVLDSGIQQNHPDLHQLPGQSFVSGGGNGGPGNSCDNHGTAVAGCIAATANNGIGIAGIAPGVYVQAGKIFNETSFFGFCLPFLESQDSWTAAGINWAGDSGAQVTNSSWGGGAPTAVITNAFNTTRDMGVIHFGAAGNDGTGTVGYPASLGSVNSVAAVDSSGNRASFSTFGPGLFISAPGAAVLTTDRTGNDGYGSGDYTTIDGTSFASPYSAGVAALVLSANASLSPSEVESILAQTAVDKGTPGYDTGYGWGFINAGQAVALAAGSACSADLNGDGNLDFFDISAFLSAFTAQDSIADFNGDGSFDFFDVSAFLGAFSAGCP